MTTEPIPNYTPGPTATAMSATANEELFRVLLESADATPLVVLGDVFLALATVISNRLHALAEDGADTGEGG